MTKKQMVDQLVAWLGLQSIDDYDEIPLVEQMIYRGTMDLLSRTRCIVRCVHLRVTAGEDTYTLDHKIMSLVDLDDGNRRRLRRDQTGDFGGAVGTVVFPDDTTPVIDTSGFTLIRSDILQVKPMPSEDGEIDVWAVLLPDPLVTDDDSVSDEQKGAIPEEYQDAILTYALWQLADYADNSTSQKGELYRVRYEGSDGRGGRLGEIRRLVNKRGTARAAPRRVRMSAVSRRSSWVG
jgi:hypothetical protein